MLMRKLWKEKYDRGYMICFMEPLKIGMYFKWIERVLLWTGLDNRSVTLSNSKAVRVNEGRTLPVNFAMPILASSPVEIKLIKWVESVIKFNRWRLLYYFW